VLTCKHAADLQAAHPRPLASWKVFFGVGLLVTPLHIVLWVYNLQALQELRRASDLGDETMGILSLVLGILLAPVGQILWAVHVNTTLETIGQAVS
jgi:hypothetical protein